MSTDDGKYEHAISFDIVVRDCKRIVNPDPIDWVFDSDPENEYYEIEYEHDLLDGLDSVTYTVDPFTNNTPELCGELIYTFETDVEVGGVSKEGVDGAP